MSFQLATSSLNCPRKYLAQLFVLSNDVEDQFVSQHIGALNHTQPNGGFIQFLKDNTNLVNEISNTLCAACFTLIRRWRGSRSHDLSGNVLTSRSSRQMSRQLYDADSEIYQTLLEFVRLRLTVRRNTRIHKTPLTGGTKGDPMPVVLLLPVWNYGQRVS